MFKNTLGSTKITVVDFTHSLPRLDFQKFLKDIITKKFWKDYQSKDRFLFVVLTNPLATKGDIKNYDKYLNSMPSDRYPDNVKIILLEDFISMFQVEKKIKEKIDYLLEIVKDCLQHRNFQRQEEGLIKLFELNIKVRYFLKLPLSQQTIERYLNL